MNLTKEIKDKIGALTTKIDREYYSLFKKLEKEDKTVKKEKLAEYIKDNIFTEVPSIAEDYTPEEYFDKFGSHSSKITRNLTLYLTNEAVQDELSKVQPIQINLDNHLETIEVSTQTGVKEFTSEDAEGNDVSVEIPILEKTNVVVIKDKGAFIEELSNSISKSVTPAIENINQKLDSVQIPETNVTESPQLDTQRIRYEAAKLVREVLSNQRVSVVDPNNNDGQVTMYLPSAIESNNKSQHYLDLVQKFINDFYRVNGIVDVEVDEETQKIVPKEDGSSHIQKAIKKVTKKTLNNGASTFAQTLFGDNNITDQNGNEIKLFTEYDKQLMASLKTRMATWINNPQTSLISTENDAKFYHLFADSINEANTKLASQYTVGAEDAWVPNIFTNPFETKEPETPYTDAMSNILNVNQNPPQSTQPNEIKTGALPQGQVINNSQNPGQLELPAENQQVKELRGVGLPDDQIRNMLNL